MPEIPEEVRYQRLRPGQVVQRRQTLPLAWLPLGILEWHGPHNPLGLDALKAEEMLCYAARQIGGLVMPPLYWGDHRRSIAEVVFNPAVSPWFPQDVPDQTAGISRAMGLPQESFQSGAARAEQLDAWRIWKELLVAMFFQIESLGFRAIAVYAGHAPLRPRLVEAAETYRGLGGAAEVVILDIPGGEDHAAIRETSLMLALCPGLANLGELDPASPRHIGVMGDDPRKASAEFGWEIVREFTADARRRLSHVIAK
jgi:creatinine amidohydrolase